MVTITITDGVMKLEGVYPNSVFVTSSNSNFRKNAINEYSIYDKVLGIDHNIGAYTNVTGMIDDAALEALLSGFFSNASNGASVETNQIELKAISKQNQTIVTDAAGMIPVPEVVQKSNGITIDANGHITFSKAGFYRIQIQLNVDNTNNTNIDTWAEVYNGSVWVSLPDSGNVKDSGNSSIGNFLIETTLNLTSPLTIRLRARTITGTAQLKYDTADGGIGVPSCTYIAYKINPIAIGIAVETSNLSDSYHIGQEASGNSTEFEPDGTWINKGNSTTWDEVSASFVGRNIFAVVGRIDYDFTELTLNYATNARYPNEPVGIVLQIPHARKAGSDLRPHIHWMQTQNANPNILVEYRTCNNGEQPSAWTLKALTVSDNALTYDGSGNMQQITEFNLPVGNGSGLGISATFEVKIYRDSNNTSGLFAGSDAYTGVWSAKYYDIHFEKDMNGSRQEFIK